MNVTTCSSCRRAIIWTISPTGAKLPLDARAVTTYTVIGDHAVKVERETPEYVSHFLTCLQPSRHSSVRREAQS